MRHLLVYPALNGCCDFEKQEMDVSGCWYRAPRSQWVAVLLPKILAAAQSGQDVTFSTWRQNFGFGNPDNYTLPAGDNFQVRLFSPMGPPFEEDNWGCATFHNSRRPPTDGGRFIFSHDGLRHQLERLFSTEFIDSLRHVNGRPRTEIWVRHRLRMCDVAPGVHPVPRILSETIGLSKEDAARKVAAMRQPTSAAEWFAIRKKDREEKERAAKLATGEGVIDVDAQSTEAETPPATQEAPPCVTREQLIEARKTKTKLRKAVRSKVAADAREKAAGQAHAAKVLKRMEARGQL